MKETFDPKTLSCPKCSAVVPTPGAGDSGLIECPNCAAHVRFVAFPALFQEAIRPVVAESVMGDGEASCFFHTGKKAIHPCSACGRFLCSLCDLEIAGEHLCASCVESGRKKGTMQQMETRRFRADKLCLSLGILSVLIFCGVFGLVALPTQIVLWALNRKKPVSLVAKWPRLGYVVGMTLSALSIIVFIALIAGVTFFPDQN